MGELTKNSNPYSNKENKKEGIGVFNENNQQSQVRNFNKILSRFNVCPEKAFIM